MISSAKCAKSVDGLITTFNDVQRITYGKLPHMSLISRCKEGDYSVTVYFNYRLGRNLDRAIDLPVTDLVKQCRCYELFRSPLANME